jgi:hypothetical protein
VRSAGFETLFVPLKLYVFACTKGHLQNIPNWDHHWRHEGTAMVGLSTKKSVLPHLEGAAQRASLLIATSLFGCALSNAQVFVVQREHLGPKDANLTAVQPTNVPLDTKPITERTKPTDSSVQREALTPMN